MELSTAKAKPYELYLFQGTGILFAITSADQTISYLGNVFTPATVTRTEIDESAEVESGQIKVYLPKNHPISQLFIPYLPTSPVSLTIFGSHYGDSETTVIFSGQVASGHFTDECELVCNSDEYRLQTKIPRIQYQSACPRIFGDPGCGVPLASVTYEGEVTAISEDGLTITIPAFATAPHALTAGWLASGNFKRMVVAQGGSGTDFFVVLIAPIAGLEVGDAVIGVAGCQQTFAACVAYNNVANFLGFDLIPLLNPFDGETSIA
jgi:uncharacterized phage protein (TIGR02218 family)